MRARARLSSNDHEASRTVMIRRVAVPALQIDPGVSLNPRSAAPSYDFADPLPRQ